MWSIAWRVFDAQFWGVPQRRCRIALVADFGGAAAPEILFERQSLPGDTEPGEPSGQKAAAGFRGCAFAAGFLPNAGAKANGVAYEQELAPTLSSQQKAAVCYSIGGYNSKAWLSDNPQSGIYETEVCRTLDTASCGSPACNQGGTAIVEIDCNARPKIYRKATKSHNTNEAPTFKEDNISSTLNTFDIGESRINELVVDWKTVRRLTPLECERLQGYPDGWTDIGEWVDSKGKLHKESSDTARYRTLGNSIALPPWRWILGRMALWLKQPATMGSLFDGIGGFPLLWEEINGAGSCLWASEIDEFCIAVTKRRFNYGG